MLITNRRSRRHPAPSATGSRFPAVLQVVLAAVAMLAASYAPNLLTIPPLAALASEPQRPTGLILQILGLVLPTVIGVLLVVLLVRLDGRERRRFSVVVGLGWKRRAAAGMAIGVGSAVVVFVGCAAALQTLGLLRPTAVDDFGSTPLVVVLIMVVLRAFTLQGFPEELVFRGYLLGSLRLSALPAILVSAASFAALHLLSSGGQRGPAEHLLYLLLPFGFAIFAGVLRTITGSVLAAVGVHGGLHIGYAICFVLGFGDGPWLWVVAGVVWSALGLLLLNRVRARPAG